MACARLARVARVLGGESTDALEARALARRSVLTKNKERVITPSSATVILQPIWSCVLKSGSMRTLVDLHRGGEKEKRNESPPQRDKREGLEEEDDCVKLTRTHNLSPLTPARRGRTAARDK